MQTRCVEDVAPAARQAGASTAAQEQVEHLGWCLTLQTRFQADTSCCYKPGRILARLRKSDNRWPFTKKSYGTITMYLKTLIFTVRHYKVVHIFVADKIVGSVRFC